MSQLYTIKDLYDDDFTISYEEGKGVIISRWRKPIFLLNFHPPQFKDEELMFQVAAQCFGDWIATLSYEDVENWWYPENPDDTPYHLN